MLKIGLLRRFHEVPDCWCFYHSLASSALLAETNIVPRYTRRQKIKIPRDREEQASKQAKGQSKEPEGKRGKISQNDP